jgi:hypothetical protein
MLELVKFCINLIKLLVHSSEFFFHILFQPIDLLVHSAEFLLYVLFQLIDFLSNAHLSLVNFIVRPIKLVVDIVLDSINQVLDIPRVVVKLLRRSLACAHSSLVIQCEYLRTSSSGTACRGFLSAKAPARQWKHFRACIAAALYPQYPPLFRLSICHRLARRLLGLLCREN